MSKNYYGRIGGDGDDYYMWLILVDEHFDCYYTNPKIPWTLQPDNAFLDVPEDTTSYDSLTEEEALKLAKNGEINSTACKIINFKIIIK